MTAVVTVETLLLVLLVLLVGGLLRSHAEILRRLDELQPGGTATAAPARTSTAAHDVSGATLAGDAMHVGVTRPGAATLLAIDHTDTLIRDGLAQSTRLWGRFDVGFTDGALPLVAAMMNLRSRLSGIATGDQAIFVTREAFVRAGGFPEIALMEDVALSTRLKPLSRPLCLGARVTTSPRRWQARGTVRTVLLMWRLRLAFSLGADPQRLARSYGYGD